VASYPLQAAACYFHVFWVERQFHLRLLFSTFGLWTQVSACHCELTDIVCERHSECVRMHTNLLGEAQHESVFCVSCNGFSDRLSAF